jgi:uncharacterized protein
MDAWRGKWAVVTGASSGIGWALAEQLAAGGAHLVLTARRRERLEQLAARLRSAHRIPIEVFPADLAEAGSPQEIFTFTESRGMVVDLLVNNAGYGAYGEFHTSDRARQLGMVQVNCAAVVHLTHLFLPGMIERRRGDILIVASTAAFQPVPYISTYAATKAFDLLFAEALAEEMARYGVRVCALCPGATATEFGSVAGTRQRSGIEGEQETAAKVARVGLEALAAGKRSVVSGFKNRLSVQLERWLPRRLVTRAAARLFRPEHLR